MAALLQTTGNFPSKQLFIPQATLDHPFDVSLMVEDGKEFKAHRRVLSEASPFFENMLNSDMREANEGVIRLEMLTELGLRDILEFIYTGSVQISAESNAQDLIAMADFLVLPHLKTLAEKFLVTNLKLEVANAISTFLFAKRYRCKELIFISKNFILANFSTVAKTENFLNLSSKEVKMWISSDEIDVGAEEDVFKIVLTWIDHEKRDRKKYFPELFREIRLVYVSRDYLLSDVVTNDLVNDNEGCMDLVKNAMKFIDSQSCHHVSVKPRKSLEIPVAVVNVKSNWQQYQFLLYFPREDKWSQRFQCGTVPLFSANDERVIFCHGKLFFISQKDKRLLCYDSFSNCWTQLPYKEKRTLLNVFVSDDDDIWALVRENETCCPECVSLRCRGIDRACEKKHLSFLTKYNLESNSWEDISSFDGLGLRVGICVVAKHNFFYFLGGTTQAPSGESNSNFLLLAAYGESSLADADRYDLSTNTWEKIADMNHPKLYAHGAVAYGKVFIAGPPSDRIELYYEATNEWEDIEFMSSSHLYAFGRCRGRLLRGMVCSDHNLFSLEMFFTSVGLKIGCQQCAIQCYDPKKDKWNVKSRPEPVENELQQWQERRSFMCRYDSICSMRIFKRSKFFQQVSISDAICSFIPPESLGQKSDETIYSDDKNGCKCSIM